MFGGSFSKKLAVYMQENWMHVQKHGEKATPVAFIINEVFVDTGKEDNSCCARFYENET